MIKMATVKSRRFTGRSRFDLHRHRLTGSCLLHLLVVEFHRSNLTNVDVTLRRDANLRPHASDPLDNVNTNDDGIALVEHAVGHDLQDAREVDVLRRGFTLVCLDLFHVRRELIKQVVDDVGGEDANVELFAHCVRLLRHRHVKSQNSSILGLFALVHDARTHDVPFVYRANGDAGDGNFDRVRFQELQQGFQRTERRRLHVHAFATLINTSKHALHIT
mmetsp:Transcript_401/g.1558  ORF Transcript_401/g.1558 Transcript_401/m.1558 type:complete len:219 (+) Transcript_401:279-935(+)